MKSLLVRVQAKVCWLSHYKKYSKPKKSQQHVASSGKASREDNRFDKKKMFKFINEKK
jgi:hypothetical protein